MSTGALPTSPSHPAAVVPIARGGPAGHAGPAPAPGDKATLLGLYHGYDRARLALARVVADLGSQAAADEATRQRIWSRAERQGIRPELFHAPTGHDLAGVGASAHSAALAAFATVSEQAESLLRRIHASWPELCEDAGGPLPVPAPVEPA